VFTGIIEELGHVVELARAIGPGGDAATLAVSAG
jgi:hypothetical protein